MKVKLLEPPIGVLSEQYKGVYGIKVIGETDVEKKILKRFYEGGVKVNGITGDWRELHLTFKDLIGK